MGERGEEERDVFPFNYKTKCSKEALSAIDRPGAGCWTGGGSDCKRANASQPVEGGAM